MKPSRSPVVVDLCHELMPALGDVIAPGHRQDSLLQPRDAINQEVGTISPAHFDHSRDVR